MSMMTANENIAMRHTENDWANFVAPHLYENDSGVRDSSFLFFYQDAMAMGMGIPKEQSQHVPRDYR
jgi:hypothetical protein